MTSAMMVRFLVALTFALLAVPATAEEVVYPPGSRIGMVPPPGLVTSRNFFGYEDIENKVAITLVTLPPDAYPSLDKSVTADALKRQGMTLESRAPMQLAMGKAFLVIGRQEIDKTKVHKWVLVGSAPDLTALVTAQVPDAARPRYPDAALRAALATVAIRNEIPIDEQLGLLPFKLSEFAGLRLGSIIPGRAAMLIDAPSDAPASAAGGGTQTQLFLAVVPGGPAQTGEREAFARDLFTAIPDLRDVRVITSEPLRIGGQQGHQILANARDGAGANDLTVVQWLRFGGGAFLQMIGRARTDQWTEAYARFRSVRDGIEPK